MEGSIGLGGLVGWVAGWGGWMGWVVVALWVGGKVCGLLSGWVGLAVWVGGVAWKARREFVRTRRQDGFPTKLPESAALGVAAGRVGDVVLPLPMDVATLHAKQKGAAASTLRGRTAHWLNSDAGQEWIKERALLFGEGGLSPDSEATSSDGDEPTEAVKKGKKARLV